MQLYERCPYSAKLRYIEHKPQKPLEPGHPMLRGRDLHKNIEEFLSRLTNVLPQELNPYTERLNQLKKRNDLHIEEKWNLDITWSTTTWAQAWLRVITDVWYPDGGTLKTIDWKSGKLEGNQFKAAQQAALGAVAAHQLFPEFKQIEASFDYFDHNKTLTFKFTTTQLEYHKKQFNESATRMLSDIEFKPRPNKSNCRFCPYGIANGTGACQFATPYED